MRRITTILLIVASSTALAIGATPFLSSSADPTTLQPPPVAGTVTIAVDRANYRQGETVAIAVKNGTNHPVWYVDAERGGRNPWWGLDRFDGTDWKRVDLWKAVKGKCVLVVSERGPIEELVKELVPGARREDRWTLTSCVEISPVGPKLELRPVEPGRYRLFFRYGPDRRSWEGSTALSGEFVLGRE